MCRKHARAVTPFLLIDIASMKQFNNTFTLVLCLYITVFLSCGAVRSIDIYLSGLLARRQNAWSQDGGNMRVIANGVNR